jgi:hypothetical protein
VSADETGNRIRTLEDVQNFIKTLSCRPAAVAIVPQKLSFLWGQNSLPNSAGKKLSENLMEYKVNSSDRIARSAKVNAIRKGLSAGLPRRVWYLFCIV